MNRREKFYKLARPDGWDFYTGKTINYREALGTEVVCPKFDKDGALCSSAFIHASRVPEQCFIGAKIPCSAFEVSGMPVAEGSDKCGFEKLIVVCELNPERLFKWDYKGASSPTHPFSIPPPARIRQWHKERLRQWASVWDSVGASVWDSVGDSVRASVGASVGASVWAYVGWIFRAVVSKWKYCEKIPGGEYPFQPAVDLWMKGLVPSYDGKLWRLHGRESAEILWEGTV